MVIFVGFRGIRILASDFADFVEGNEETRIGSPERALCDNARETDALLLPCPALLFPPFQYKTPRRSISFVIWVCNEALTRLRAREARAMTARVGMRELAKQIYSSFLCNVVPALLRLI